jgi:hypothetical protein
LPPQKKVGGVAGAMAAGAGAVLLAASIEVPGPDGTKKPNPLALGLQRLGLPTIDSVKGKV